MKLLFASVFFLVLVSFSAQSQGCVAIRSGGGMCMTTHSGNSLHDSSKWSLNINNRYFRSFRHFRGEHEEKQRVEQKTEVINNTNSTDFTLVRQLDSRWSLSLGIPIISNVRSSLYEHDSKTRHHTRSFGLGDMRFAVYRWMAKPENMPKGNIQIGIGIKLPTGDYRYQDYFYRNDSTQVLAPVDQSIQLGDGGTGFTTEVNAYYTISNHINLYGNLFYLINPREHNGTSTSRGATPNSNAIKNRSTVMSVPDQYMVRFGGNFNLAKFTFSAGGRMEAIPSEDLIGGSNGFRRPGHVISAEPGVTYNTKKINIYAFAPIAIERKRTQSVPDKLQTKRTGVYTIGDAAFADYAITIGATFKL